MTETAINPIGFIHPTLETYCNLPWLEGGLTRAGLDCRGLALLWLQEQKGLVIFNRPPTVGADRILRSAMLHQIWRAGDILFFRHKQSGRPCHVAIHIGHGRLLHILAGCESRIDNGPELLRRLGLEPMGALGSEEADKLCQALNNPDLGWVQVIALLIGLALSFIAAQLTPKPKLPRFLNQTGRYSQNPLVTQTSSELPLADLLGSVVVAGNAIYSQLIDNTQSITDKTLQMWNKIVVLGSAPFDDFDTLTGLKINGLSYEDQSFHSGTVIGFRLDPAQTKAEAVTGSISGDSTVPSISRYDGAHAISVPVDVRAWYDRTLPIYGLSGCGYLVFRLANGEVLGNFNLICRVKGRLCRQFDENGFITATAAAEDLPGADGVKVRFALANADVISISSLTVGATSFTEIGPGNQSGDVYRLNKLKGYVEFITAPAAASTITITYDYYPRTWTQNNVAQIIYLLTEPLRGKGFSEDKIDWSAADAFATRCDEQIVIQTADGPITRPRYEANYAIDARKPIQEHMRAILDACHGSLFISSGKFVVRERRAGASIFSFDQTNILKGSFSSELVERADRANRLHVFYHSEDSQNSETELIVDDQLNQDARADRAGNNGIVDENLKFPAVTNLEQAQLLAMTILAEEVNANYVCEFTTTVKGLALEPEDIISVTHSSQPGWSAKQFRILKLDHDENDYLKLQAAEYFGGAYQ
jgi:hypothetical protein